MRITPGLTVLLGLLAAIGPISTDIYLPAFAIIDREFHHIGGAQMTLAAWFGGIAVGQLIQGPLSDRLGRRTPLLLGTLVFAAASIACAVAPTLASFSACRVLAALGGSVGMVIPRALVRDVSDGMAAAKTLSRLTLVMGVVPILAPALGGMMMVFMDWRDLFWFAGLFGLAIAFFVWRSLPDTLPPERRLRHNLMQTLTRYVQVGTERVFITNALQMGFAFGSLFVYVGGSASIYTQHFHLTPQQYGMLFGVNACAYIAATQAAPRLAGRYGSHLIVHIGARGQLLFYGLAALAALTHFGGLAGMAVPIFCAQAMYGLLGPLNTVGALTRHRAHAGSASALLGTLQFSLGALGDVLISLCSDGSPRPMVLLMVLFAALGVGVDCLRPAVSFDS